MSFPEYPAYSEPTHAWLGALPSHWAVKRLRFLARLNPSKREVVDAPGSTEVVYLPMSAIGETGVYETDNLRPLEALETGYSYARQGDIAIAKVTPCFENGKGAFLDALPRGFCFGTTELTVIRANDPTRSRYLYWLLSSPAFRWPAQADMVGAGGLKRVPDDTFKDFPVPIPAHDEVEVICAFLDNQIGKIDRLVVQASQQPSVKYGKSSLLGALQERRAALIYAAVTGKIDVRGLGSQPLLAETA